MLSLLAACHPAEIQNWSKNNPASLHNSTLPIFILYKAPVKSNSRCGAGGRKEIGRIFHLHFSKRGKNRENQEFLLDACILDRYPLSGGQAALFVNGSEDVGFFNQVRYKFYEMNKNTLQLSKTYRAAYVMEIFISLSLFCHAITGTPSSSFIIN